MHAFKLGAMVVVHYGGNLAGFAVISQSVICTGFCIAVVLDNRYFCLFASPSV